MRTLPAVAVALAAATITTGTAYAIEVAGPHQAPLGPGLVTLEVGIDQSRFDLGTVEVRRGTVLELVVRNDDPIDHELVIGDEAVHLAHRDGTESRHPPVPGEVSVRPLSRAMTFYAFDELGPVEYVCHLPGHEAYGMRGEIEVVP